MDIFDTNFQMENLERNIHLDFSIKKRFLKYLNILNLNSKWKKEKKKLKHYFLKKIINKIYSSTQDTILIFQSITKLREKLYFPIQKISSEKLSKQFLKIF